MTKELCDKLIKSCDYLILPVAGVASIWNVDISIYASAGFGAIASILSFVKLFCKE